MAIRAPSRRIAGCRPFAGRERGRDGHRLEPLGGRRTGHTSRREARASDFLILNSQTLSCVYSQALGHAVGSARVRRRALRARHDQHSEPTGRRLPHCATGQPAD
jgi:hypothetical protein